MKTFAQIPDFSTYPAYNGDDLGMNYAASATTFRLWSPAAEKVEIKLYNLPIGGQAIDSQFLQRSVNGTWSITLQGDRSGNFYAFRVMVKGKWQNEVPDIYAKLVGVNGRRGFIGNIDRADPEGWDQDKSPKFSQPTDAVIYELHVRDASIHAASGIRHKGKFLGLTELGTQSEQGLSTGLDHLKELGVTHVHLLPSYDFYTIDETRTDLPQYNWGYDPLNYNVPEGSYSTNARDPFCRIREFKQLIKTLHENGIRVVMDVVYNHTMLTEDSWFNQLVPGYYYRQNKEGGFSNASACNNETASERPMMRKFILESVKYWVNAFHVDGFRFDLMGIHDIETMNLIADELRKIKPDILLYGEGWTAGASPLPDDQRAIKKNASKLNEVAVFSDDIRDGIKGSVFEHADPGFASGKKGMEESIKFGIVAACPHPQVAVEKVNYSKAFYASSPAQVITYCECHDNHVLWDKIRLSTPGATDAQRRNIHKLALTTVLTSQGISFLHAGTEFLRTKQGVENSFQSPDSINAIDWSLKAENKDVFELVKGLIAMRKQHPAFRLSAGDAVARSIRFLQDKEGVVSYVINGEANQDEWKEIFVALNGTAESKSLSIPPGKWQVFLQDHAFPANKKAPTSIKPFSALILYQK